MKGDKNIFKIGDTFKYIKEQDKERYYPHSGLETYVGGQGKGKTISAVKRIKEILEKYPELTFISNVKIKGIENANYFKDCDQLVEYLKAIDIENNKGYLIFIDEIHVVLAELFGKTDPIFIQFLSQQRKLSIHIIGTSQMFNYLPKFIRKYLVQSGQIIMCSKYFKIVQILRYIDMETVIENKDGTFEYSRSKIKWYLHNKELYESYNTYAVISQIQGLMNGGLTYGARLPVDNGSTTEKSLES